MREAYGRCKYTSALAASDPCVSRNHASGGADPELGQLGEICNRGIFSVQYIDISKSSIGVRGGKREDLISLVFDR